MASLEGTKITFNSKDNKVFSLENSTMFTKENQRCWIIFN